MKKTKSNKAKAPIAVSMEAAASARVKPVEHAIDRRPTWTPAQPPPGVLPSGMAMDDCLPANFGQISSWGLNYGIFAEGLGFLGYPYLAELTQRAEYRRVCEKWAEECTRKWIRLTGQDDEKLAKLKDAMERFEVQERFRRAIELDAQFGRAHLYPDLGKPASDGAMLVPSPSTVGKGKFRGLRVIEPMWTYPRRFESTNPLDETFYKPQTWSVMTRDVHSSRLMTIVGREVPDMLKPTYAFGGLSLTQMVKSKVDNYLRNLQSGSDLLNAFSVMVLMTDMGSVLTGGDNGNGLYTRIDMFNRTRDNRGTMVVDKNMEDLKNVSAQLAGVEGLIAQAQEHIASACGIPLVILLGVTPSGLNASSDGEIRTFYDTIAGFQKKVLRSPLQRVIELIQLSEFGSIDPGIGFEFESLWEMSDTDKAAIRKSDADAAAIYVNAGVISNEEERDRLSNEEGGMYQGVDLSGPPPELEPPEPVEEEGAETADA